MEGCGARRTPAIGKMVVAASARCRRSGGRPAALVVLPPVARDVIVYLHRPDHHLFAKFVYSKIIRS
jgi:hypothetical protein